jgi:hypothetical protein
MKTKKYLLLLLTAVSFSFAAHAQEAYEEVVYLKNGNVYRGLIIEQIPNESLKIQSRDGNIFSVPMVDLLKITKEKKFNPAPPKPVPTTPSYNNAAPSNGYGEMSKKSCDTTTCKKSFYQKKKGYFFEAQILVEALQGGARIVNGYKFGRLGYLGVGVGVDIVPDFPFGNFGDRGGRGGMFGNNRNTLDAGIYLPLYLRYSGDILKKKITPFYAIEAGYAAHLGGNNTPFNGGGGFNSERSFGGPMGGVALGVKFNTKHRVNFSLSMNADFKTNFKQTPEYFYDQYGNYNYTGKSTQLQSRGFGGLRFAIGF